MYYKTTLETTPEHIMFIPYESAPQSVRKYFESNLMDTENKDIFVAYSITDKEPIPLGYCVIDKLNISHSRYIETLFQNTANFNNTEVNIEQFNCIQKKKCVRILESKSIYNSVPLSQKVWVMI